MMLIALTPKNRTTGLDRNGMPKMLRKQVWTWVKNAGHSLTSSKHV